MNSFLLNGFLVNFFKKYLKFILVLKNEIYICVDYKELFNFIYILKMSLLFQTNSLLDIVGLDFIYKHYSYISDNRFKLIYVLNSYCLNKRLKVVVSLPYNEFYVDSISNLFDSSNWLEREVFDFFGIFFVNHPDLRRILTDYGFNGFPLRKNFPLNGFLEVKYSFNNKRINFSRVYVVQEFRNFSYDLSWNLV